MDCSKCGAQNPQGSNFCIGCAAPLSSAPAAQAAQPQARAAGGFGMMKIIYILLAALAVAAIILVVLLLTPKSPSPGGQTAPACGDALCTSPETCSSCPADCGACQTGPRCGDALCTSPETCSSCPADCGACPATPRCGDNSCNALENCSSCPSDCGACPAAPKCGDSSCNGQETCSSCPADCGVCPSSAKAYDLPASEVRLAYDGPLAYKDAASNPCEQFGGDCYIDYYKVVVEPEQWGSSIMETCGAAAKIQATCTCKDSVVTMRSDGKSWQGLTLQASTASCMEAGKSQTCVLSKVQTATASDPETFAEDILDEASERCFITVRTSGRCICP